MLPKEHKEELERQAYRFVGPSEHTTVKVCGWTKKMIKGEGGCYKLKFYGIMSNQCMQMSTSISCANRCVFCWRGHKAPVSEDWTWGVDDPELLLNESIKAHHQLLIGMKGNPKKVDKLYNDSRTVRHVALSLTGEPIMYPRINEYLDLCHKNKISTFLVTNAQYAEEIKKLNTVTQLYVSLDAPNKELLKEVDVPLFRDYWERLNKSLEYLSEKKDTRTCIRITAIKDLNMVEPENYAKLIQKSNADFIEVKAYMFVGASRQRLDKKNMPFHEEVVDFSKELAKFLPEYEIVSEHIPSRVVMFAKKEFKINNKWMTWIDFDKFFELLEQKEQFDKFDFLKETPSVGLSGKGTLDLSKKKKERKESGEVFVNEDTEETILDDEE